MSDSPATTECRYCEHEHGPAFGPDTVLVTQVVVKAGLIPVAGVTRPVLVFTGRDSDGKTLPQWLYCAVPGEIRKVVKLVADMGEMAIRRARQAGVASWTAQRSGW